MIVSNRGPKAFRRAASGQLAAHPGAGGLASGLSSIAAAAGATWVSAAMTDGDREAAATGRADDAGMRFRFLSLEHSRYRLAYDVIANQTLWPLHHRLFDLARQPCFDPGWWTRGTPTARSTAPSPKR